MMGALGLTLGGIGLLLALWFVIIVWRDAYL